MNINEIITENDKSTIIHLTSIKDKPKYPHRGFMVDTSRHYLSLYMLKKSIDAMVMSKLNIVLLSFNLSKLLPNKYIFL